MTMFVGDKPVMVRVRARRLGGQVSQDEPLIATPDQISYDVEPVNDPEYGGVFEGVSPYPRCATGGSIEIQAAPIGTVGTMYLVGAVRHLHITETVLFGPCPAGG